MKKITNCIVTIFSLIIWVLIMLLPYCLSVKMVEFIDNRQYRK